MDNKKHFKGSIVIADPSYFVITDEDWEKCKYGDDMTQLGFTDYLCISFPDDPQIVKNESTGEVLGDICQDSGRILVVLKEELESYNPDYESAIGEDNFAVIEDFDGIVTSERVPYEDDDFDTVVKGEGNISFRSCYEDD